MLRTASVDSVAAWLEGVPDIVEIEKGDVGVRFRPRGGRAAWILAPADTANPRLGGAPAPMASGPSREPTESADRTAQAAGGEGPGIASKGGPGKPKHALVLSPFEFEGRHVGNRAAELALTARDYEKDHGGSVVYHADLVKGQPNPGTLSLDERRVSGQVSLEDFYHWNDYNFIYLSTHGGTACVAVEPLPLPGSKKACYTMLLAGQIAGGDFFRGLPQEGVSVDLTRIPGVSIAYTHDRLSPLLSKQQLKQCVAALQADSVGPGVARDPAGDFETLDGKSCLDEDRLTAPDVILTTAFFASVYPHGLENVVVYVEACEGMKSGDLPWVLTNHRRNTNVAVMGFDAVVYRSRATEIGTALVDLLGEQALDSHEVIRELQKRFPKGHFTGFALSAGAATGPPAKIVDLSSNPTYARDIVELVDPFTGAELVDGGDVAVVGQPGDGRPDSLLLEERVLGIAGHTSIQDIDVFVGAAGHEDAGRKLARRVSDHVWATAGHTAPLGVDAHQGQTVDLQIRATLEGGSESRWTYRDVHLVACSTRWSATLDGPAVGHVRLEGTDADLGTPGDPLSSVHLYANDVRSFDLKEISGPNRPFTVRTWHIPARSADLELSELDRLDPPDTGRVDFGGEHDRKQISLTFMDRPYRYVLGFSRQVEDGASEVASFSNLADPTPGGDRNNGYVEITHHSASHVSGRFSAKVVTYEQEESFVVDESFHLVPAMSPYRSTLQGSFDIYAQGSGSCTSEGVN